MGYVLAMHPGNRLRELRKKAGIRQIELANAVGVSQPAISQVENGDRPLTIEWMRAFARVLGCTTADLLTDEDNPARLTPDELDLVLDYRAGGDVERTTIKRVASSILPFRGQEGEKAA